MSVLRCHVFWDTETHKWIVRCKKNSQRGFAVKLEFDDEEEAYKKAKELEGTNPDKP